MNNDNRECDMEAKKIILDFLATDYSDAEACDEENIVHRCQ